ncbi:hypothetical protein [Agrobacterium tumefaciens]|uniref:hypothetical protein n=1 Tax=Agrobacterium tumefaciens complex TaxID=1183400 RepID=UPI0013AE9ADB|nr:hypothetical protein [Agrobacterium tumefaciens]
MNNEEPAEVLIVPEHPRKISRIAATVAVMGSLIWVQWPIDLAKIGIAPVVALIASSLTWISVELAEFVSDNSTRDSILVDDVKKLNAILKLVDRHQAYILREHAIETSIRDTDYDGIRELVNYYKDDIFPFHNESLQARYEQLCRDAEHFLHDFFNLYTSDGRGWMTWRAAEDGWVPQDVYDRVMGRIANLNRQTTALSSAWEELVALALQELKGASVAIDRYE